MQSKSTPPAPIIHNRIHLLSSDIDSNENAVMTLLAIIKHKPNNLKGDEWLGVCYASQCKKWMLEYSKQLKARIETLHNFYHHSDLTGLVNDCNTLNAKTSKIVMAADLIKITYTLGIYQQKALDNLRFDYDIKLGSMRSNRGTQAHTA